MLQTYFQNHIIVIINTVETGADRRSTQDISRTGLTIRSTSPVDTVLSRPNDPDDSSPIGGELPPAILGPADGPLRFTAIVAMEGRFWRRCLVDDDEIGAAGSILGISCTCEYDDQIDREKERAHTSIYVGVCARARVCVRKAQS